MEEQIKKLEMHIIRLEQCIRQIQQLRKMGLVNDEQTDRRIDQYLDQILETKKRLQEIKSKTKGDTN